MTYTTPLISVADLADTLYHTYEHDKQANDEPTEKPHVVVLDATVDAQPTDPHIPGAHVASIEGVWSDPDAEWPHTKPRAEALQEELRRLGVHDSSHVVVYERGELFAAPRIWWLLKSFGIENATILNGGFDAWASFRTAATPTDAAEEAADAALPVTTEPTPAPRDGTVTLRPVEGAIIEEGAVRDHVLRGDRRILDARSRARFEGTQAEPRPGVRSGHIPGASSAPYSELQDAGWMLPEAELQRILGPLLDERPVVTACGSGVTACVIALALDVIGRKDVAVYDGSWTQWGREGGPAIETGADRYRK